MRLARDGGCRGRWHSCHGMPPPKRPGIVPVRRLSARRSALRAVRFAGMVPERRLDERSSSFARSAAGTAPARRFLARFSASRLGAPGAPG